MRFVLPIAVVLALLAAVAHGEPTPADLATAKILYEQGKARYEAKDYLGATTLFKESFRLSQNQKLLLNVAVAYQDSGDNANAIAFYEQFLAGNPPDSPEKTRATEQVAALKALVASTPGEPAEAPGPQPERPRKSKPAGTYSAEDFEHVTVMEAPPGQPLDLSAYVPEDSGFDVALYYRGAGEAKYTGVVMAWRYRELVGRIPSARMNGNSVQYYIEAKDKRGEVIARSGKPSSPNVVDVVANVPPRYYPDWTEGKPVADVGASQKQPTVRTAEPKGSWLTPGTKKFGYAKWGATGGAVALLSLGAWAYVSAGQHAQALEDEARNNPVWDSYLEGLQSTGKSRQTLSRISLVFGVGAGAAAGYLWYRELKGNRTSVGLVPTTDGKSVGATLAGSF